MDGVTRQSVARVTTDTGRAQPVADPAGCAADPMIAWDLEARRNTLYGGFGEKPNFAAAFDLTTGLQRCFGRPRSRSACPRYAATAPSMRAAFGL
jgi:hypothetical protein